jgi:hypothetical protein
MISSSRCACDLCGCCCDGRCYSYVPERRGCYAWPYVYVDPLGPGGATAARMATKIGDNEGWRKQLGQLAPPAGFPCPEGQQFDMSTWQCVPIPAQPPGYEPPGDIIPPGGVEPQACTIQDYMPGGRCAPGAPGFPGAPPPGTPAPPAPICHTDADVQVAYQKGKTAARAEVVTTTVITAGITAVVGIGVGWLLGR